MDEEASGVKLIANACITIINESIVVGAVIFWMIGIAAAKGWAMTVFASIFPPAAWVLAAKHFIGA